MPRAVLASPQRLMPRAVLGAKDIKLRKSAIQHFF
jgi:hypothetical protein